MDLSVKISTCPICRVFSTTSVDTFLSHLKEHECTRCTLYHKNTLKFWKSCLAAQKVIINCCARRCDLTFESFESLQEHLDLKHKKCRLSKRYICECYNDIPVLQYGGDEGSAESERGEDDSQKEEHGQGRNGQANIEQEQPNIPYPVVQSTMWRPWDPRPSSPRPSTSHAVQTAKLERVSSPQPGPSHIPTPANLQRVDEDERAKYYMLRDRMCSHCPMTFQTREDCHRHCVNAHPELCEELPAMEVEDPLDIKLVRQALEDTYRKYDVNLDNIEVEDVNALFLAMRKKYKNVVKLLLKKYRNLKMQFRINCQFYREDGGVITYAFVPMESFNFVVENDQYGNFAFRTALSNFNVRIEDFQENGSGWIFQRLNEFSILFSEYQAFIGRGGTSPLPPLLCRKRNSLLNVPGDDEFCFLRCLIAALYKHELPRANRKSFLLRRKFYDDRMDRIHQDLDLSGIHFPFNTKQAKKFEFQNPRYGLNIFMYNEALDEIEPQLEVKYTSDNTVPECELPDAILNYNYERAPENWKEKMKIYKELRRNIYPLSLCKEERDIIIDILLIQDGDDGHYILIENLLSLVKIPHSTQKFICRYCLQTFDKQAKTHEEFCASLGRMRTDFPERKFLMWESYKNTIPLLFLEAMDFESRLKPVDITKRHTQKIKKHIAAGYAWAISDNDGNLVSHKKYVALNDEECVAEKMLLELLVEADKVAEQVKDWNKEAYDLAKKSNSLAHRIKHDEKCGFCDELIFSEGNSQYVRHHQHYPPFKFEFYAHPFCNTTAQTSRKLVVLAHNLRGYDSHFHRVEVIGTSSEKFFAVFVGKNLVFTDSLTFFSASLETVAGTMDKKTDFKLSRKYIMSQYHDEAKVELKLRKGVYPYDFFSDLSKYDETQLPPAKDFYDSLGNKEVNPLDYEHVQTVWRELGVRNLREYTELYNISDVLLLLDCFNKLRDVFMKNFGLDPGHFFSLPHLTWECALKETKAKLDYIKDPEMMTFLESAIRGGVASGLEYRAAKQIIHISQITIQPNLTVISWSMM